MGVVSPLRKWWTKVSHYEFWPFDVFYFPVKLYYLFLAVKSRSFFFFTASNPSIEFGGMLGEKKSEIFNLIPQKYIPKTRLFTAKATAEEVSQYLEVEGINYPIILKPDIGERGWMVQRVTSFEDLQGYLGQIKVDFLVQELVDLPIELGVFFIKLPGESTGKVTSVVKKGFLSVTGDGNRSVRDLLRDNVRALLQVDFGDPSFQQIMNSVPARGEEMLVEKVGNHCRGTTFLDGQDFIDADLDKAFNQIASEIPDFYFGRFDIRCQSIEYLKERKNFKILELNGAGSEPGHIYQPGHSIWKAYSDVLWHLKMLQKVSSYNKKLGHEYWSFKKGWNKIREIRTYNSLKES